VRTRSPRRTSVPEPVCVNSSFASSSGRVIDTDEDSGKVSSSALICSIFTLMPPWIQGCSIRCSYSVDRLIESITLPASSSSPPGPGEEDDLVRLQLLHEFVGGEVGVDVEDLPARGFAQAGDHGDRTRLQAGLDRREVHARTSPTRP
jgi:hypothetical protein